MLNPELDVRLRASGVTHDVVDAFFEDQEDLAPSVGPQLYVSLVARRVKPKSDVASAEYVACEATHLFCQIAQMILAWIDRPDDVPHRVHEFPRRVGNQRQRLSGLSIILALLHADDFTGHRNQGQIRPDIIMQVCCDASANPL